MMYLRLFHGRTDPQQDMDDWGSDGPVLGPYKFAHRTYPGFAGDFLIFQHKTFFPRPILPTLL